MKNQLVICAIFCILFNSCGENFTSGNKEIINSLEEENNRLKDEISNYEKLYSQEIDFENILKWYCVRCTGSDGSSLGKAQGSAKALGETDAIKKICGEKQPGGATKGRCPGDYNPCGFGLISCDEITDINSFQYVNCVENQKTFDWNKFLPQKKRYFVFFKSGDKDFKDSRLHLGPIEPFRRRDFCVARIAERAEVVGQCFYFYDYYKGMRIGLFNRGDDPAIRGELRLKVCESPNAEAIKITVESNPNSNDYNDGEFYIIREDRI